MTVSVSLPANEQPLMYSSVACQDPELVVSAIVDNITLARPALFNGVGYQALGVRLVCLLVM